MLRRILSAAAITGLFSLGAGAFAPSAFACGAAATADCAAERAVAGAVARARETVDSVSVGRLPGPGDVSVPSLGPIIGPGPVGPGPIGDIFRRAIAIVDSTTPTVNDTVHNVVGRTPDPGDVSVPSLGPIIGPGPVGPGPIGKLYTFVMELVRGLTPSRDVGGGPHLP